MNEEVKAGVFAHTPADDLRAADLAEILNNLEPEAAAGALDRMVEARAVIVLDRPEFLGASAAIGYGNSFSVMGLDPSGKSVGPLSSVTLSSGRAFTSSDKGADVVVLDAAYAKTASKAVGDSVTIGGTAFKVIGIVSATGADSTTAANAYIPIGVAQTLSGQASKISSVYVTAASSSDIDQIKADLTKAIPGATVSTQADLASSVSGSLGSAGQLIATPVACALPPDGVVCPRSNNG